MNAVLSQIVNKYHGLASHQVINAVKTAAVKTGADFSFLMEKASAESDFNPSAKSKNSTATGLFQFIESTWLGMVKEHGWKYGLGKLADQIEMKNGKPCVDNCKMKDAILSLRKNPEIAALMAGEFTAGNKQYLKSHTEGDVGATELYLAHFMGASGASQFLNSRENNGATPAAHLFPKEARANKKVFFDSVSGQPRTLDQVYDHFAQKFDNGVKTAKLDNGAISPSPSALPPRTQAGAGSISAPAQFSSPQSDIAQALFYSKDTIIWNDEVATDVKSGFSRLSKVSADNILMLAQMNAAKARAAAYNS